MNLEITIKQIPSSEDTCEACIFDGNDVANVCEDYDCTNKIWVVKEVK